MEVKILQQEGHHFLWIDGDCWMWDLPTEVEAQEMLAAQAHGEVLVAGYGLGIVQKALLRNERVTKIFTVELHNEVLRECRRVFGMELHGFAMQGDFYETPGVCKYDCVIGDIWLDVAPRYLREYRRFKVKAESLLNPGGKVLAWGSECFDIWFKESQQRPLDKIDTQGEIACSLP